MLWAKGSGRKRGGVGGGDFEPAGTRTKNSRLMTLIRKGPSKLSEDMKSVPLGSRM